MLVNTSTCGREYMNPFIISNSLNDACFVLLCLCVASPFLLFTRTLNIIQRVYLDGTMYSTVYTGGSNVRGLDFDFRYILLDYWCYCNRYGSLSTFSG